MIPLSLREVAEATSGALVDADPRAVVTGSVVADSRTVSKGSLFVALGGEHHDGHDFAGQASIEGAVAALVARPVAGVPCIVVDDVLAALGTLARRVLDRLPELVVVGITGSSGKTSTKDLLAQVLERLGPTVAPPGSLNNELGLPLTVLSADAGTRHLVLEMGARSLGNIRYLCEVAPPRVGVVLNVGTAHVGVFGGREAIAATKAELVDSLPHEGLAVLNADDPLVLRMRASAPSPSVTFGLSAEADVRATEVVLDRLGRPSFTLVAAQGSAPVSLQLSGEHHVGNALAAATVALHLGMPLADVAAALSAAGARSRWRMEVTERGDGVVVINDAYNANPESTRAALKALVTMAAGRRSWAVLGEMRELGDDATAEHDAIGRLAVRLDVSRLVVVGEGAKAMHLGAQMEGSWAEESTFVPDADAAAALLVEQVAPGDVVLVKASRLVGLERVAEALLSYEAPSGGAR